jgi:hypothetical protein
MPRVCFALILAASLAAQAVTIPSAAATQRPTSSTFYNSSVFFSTSSTTTPHDSRTQLIYSTADITVPAGIWNSIAFRRPTGLGNANTLFTANAVITASVSQNAYTAMTTTFATNHGTNVITLLSGQISLPNSTNPPTWPAAWETPFPFTTPLPYARPMGQSLVIDLHQTNNSGTTPWYVEAQYPDTGTRVNNPPGAQSNCRFSNNSYNSAIGYRLPAVGGSWTLNYQGGLPTGLMGVGALGAQGAGGMWAGQTLPFTLALWGAPNCSWGVSADFTQPLTSTTNIYQWPTYNIPNDPNLGGQSFYDHALFVDPGANPAGWVTTWSSKWTIGTNKGSPAAIVFATGANAANPTGTYQPEVGISTRLN